MNIYITSLKIWQFALKMLHLWNPPNPKTQIPRYKFKLNQNLNLNLHCELPKDLVSRFGGFRGCCIFGRDCRMELLWDDSFMSMPHLVYAWNETLMRVTRLILISAWSCWGTTHDSWMCDTTPLCAWHKTFIRVTQLILVPASSCRGGTTHECVGHNSSVCVTRLIYACDLTHWYLSVEGSRDQSYMCVTKLIRIRETTTGWRRPTGCLKLQVIFLQKSH